MPTPKKLFEPSIVRAAAGEAFRKLDPGSRPATR